MALKSNPDNANCQINFTIREHGQVTNLYKSKGLDLRVEQKTASSYVYMPHFGSSSIGFYCGLLKFLHATNSDAPQLKSRIEGWYDDGIEYAISTANAFAHQDFPIKYEYYPARPYLGISDPLFATLSMLRHRVNEPELLINVSHDKTMAFSVHTAMGIAEAIVGMYQGYESFGIAYLTFLGQARIQEIEQERQRKQAEFPFLVRKCCTLP